MNVNPHTNHFPTKALNFCIALLVTIINPLMTVWTVESLLLLALRSRWTVILPLSIAVLVLLAVSISIFSRVEFLRDRILNRVRTEGERARDAFAILPGGMGMLLILAGYTTFPLLKWCEMQYGDWFVLFHVRAVLIAVGLLLMFIGAFIGNRSQSVQL